MRKYIVGSFLFLSSVATLAANPWESWGSNLSDGMPENISLSLLEAGASWDQEPMERVHLAYKDTNNRIRVRQRRIASNSWQTFGVAGTTEGRFASAIGTHDLPNDAPEAHAIVASSGGTLVRHCLSSLLCNIPPLNTWTIWGSTSAAPVTGNKYFKTLDVIFDWESGSGAGGRTYLAFADTTLNGRLSIVSRIGDSNWVNSGLPGITSNSINEVSLYRSFRNTSGPAYVATAGNDGIRVYKHGVVFGIETWTQVGPTLGTGALRLDLAVDYATGQPYVVYQRSDTLTTPVARLNANLSAWEYVGSIPADRLCKSIDIASISNEVVLGCLRRNSTDNEWFPIAMRYSKAFKVWMSLGGPAIAASTPIFYPELDMVYVRSEDAIYLAFQRESNGKLEVIRKKNYGN